MVKKSKGNGIYYIIFAWAILVTATYLITTSYGIFSILGIFSFIISYTYRRKYQLWFWPMVLNQYLSLLMIFYIFYILAGVFDLSMYY